MPGKKSLTADTIYYSGKIITMSQADLSTMVEAVAVRDGKILAAGKDSEIFALGISNTTKKVNLDGRTMLPGFIDAHGHFPWNGYDELFGVKLFCPPIGTINNIEQMLVVLKKKADQLGPKEWILGRGYDDSLLYDKRHPTRHDLDKVSTHTPDFHRTHFRPS